MMVKIIDRGGGKGGYELERIKMKRSVIEFVMSIRILVEGGREKVAFS